MSDLEELKAVLNDTPYVKVDPNPLTLGEKVKGYTQSALSGVTANYNDEIEAALGSILSSLGVGNGAGYDELLGSIRNDQKRFKDKTDYTDNAVEIASSFANPMSYFGKAAKAVEGLKTIGNIISNPVVQGIVSGTGAADSSNGDSTLYEGIKGGAAGGAAAAIGSIFGSSLRDPLKQSQRLKTSAYGVTASDVGKQIKKLGDNVASIDEVPLITNLREAERRGFIDVNSGSIDNVKSLAFAQKNAIDPVLDLINATDKVAAPKADFQLTNTLNFINKLSGSAKRKAEKAATEEIDALIEDIGVGKIADLQKAKVGLNYKFDQNPYSEDIIKALRSDLRAEIETRVDDAAKLGIIPGQAAGMIKKGNQEFGKLADLKDVFIKRVGKEYGGDVVEDIIGSGRTSGGTGTLNIAGLTGNPLALAASAGLNYARLPSVKNQLSDLMYEGAPVFKAVGTVLDEALTGTSGAQAYKALKEKPKDVTDPAKYSIEDLNALKGLLSDIPDIAPESVQPEKKADKFEANKITNLDLDAVRRVESNDGKNLYSPTGPVGPYQFTKDTAKKYGLIINDKVDERLDETKARAAAKKLLEDELKALGDKKLAFAAYNQGRGIIKDATKAAKSNDWNVVKQYVGNDEGSTYPAKIDAAINQLLQERA